MRSYSCKTTVRGQEYTSGCYDINMLNAVVRLIGENWHDFKIKEESPTRWIIQYGARMWIIEDMGAMRAESTRKTLKPLKV